MHQTSLSKIRLLYIEDDQNIRPELAELLKDECRELIVATNGEEGLQHYREAHPDVILTDIRMPKMDGITMVKAIREENPHIPIIVSSAFSDTDYLLEAIRIGIHYYLLKPVNLKQLFDTLEEVAAKIVETKRLKEQEQILAQYKEVVDESSIVSKASPKGIITYVNDAFIKMSGYSKEELVGQKHNIVRHPDMRASTFKEMWETILAKKKWTGVVKNRTKSGESYYVDSTITPILGINDEIVEFISIRKDITERELQREKLENKLYSSAKTLDEKIAFIDEFEKAIKSSTLFCRTTSDGTITMASEAFDKLFGYKEGELGGMDYMTLIKPEDRQKLKKKIGGTTQSGTQWQGLVEHCDIEGKAIYLESSFIPIVGMYGEILEVFCFYVDLTESVHLNEEIVATQREVISTMGAIGETRSKETGAHVRRVAEYSRLLALKVGLSLEEAEELKMASPMHDIGKVGIPDSILNKPGKLTEDEFETMKTHASLGYEMLRHSRQKLLRSAAIVAREHHERWDGNGYPNGTSGKAIHIYGRITAVADVFDALGHDRVYKKAWPLEKILALFREERARQFDPELIDLFLDNLDEFLAIKAQFDDESE